MYIRTRFTIPMLVLSIALAGCSTLSGCSFLSGQSSVAEQAPGTLLAAEKTLTMAHYALASVGQTLIDLSTSGVLRGENAATAKVWYDRADDALMAADTADRAANAAGILEAIKLAEEAIYQANAIISPLKK